MNPHHTSSPCKGRIGCSFRARGILAFFTQGVALGCYILHLWCDSNFPIFTHPQAARVKLSPCQGGVSRSDEGVSFHLPQAFHVNIQLSLYSITMRGYKSRKIPRPHSGQIRIAPGEQSETGGTRSPTHPTTLKGSNNYFPLLPKRITAYCLTDEPLAKPRETMLRQ